MRFTALVITCVLALVPITGRAETPVGTAFTYQGRLEQNGAPVTGDAEFEFALWDAPVGGSRVSEIIQTVGGHPVVDGLFTIELNFTTPEGEVVYDGRALWMEVAVDYPAGAGQWETLAPRQYLSATPYAAHALEAANVPWEGIEDLPAGSADGVDDVGTGAFWSLTGNGGTIPGTNFLGTTDNVPLELRVNDTPAMVIEPDQIVINAANGVGINTNGPLAGLHVESGSVALLAQSTATSGTTFGGYFSVDSPDGYGVCAINYSAATSDVPAIYGEHVASDWLGVGVQGVGSGIGVQGTVIPEGGLVYTAVDGIVVGGTGWNTGVSGTAIDGELTIGVVGSASDGDINYGVYGEAYGGQTNYAGYFDGPVFSSGEITKNFNDEESRAAPLAYGYVHWHGGHGDTTGNVVSTMFNTTGVYYEIDIADADFSDNYYYNYAVTVTIQGTSPAIATWTGSPDGKLHIHTWDLNGNPQSHRSFCFVVFKPTVDEQTATRSLPTVADRKAALKPQLTRPPRIPVARQDALAELNARVKRLEAQLEATNRPGEEVAP